jgi:hypothetical protein
MSMAMFGRIMGVRVRVIATAFVRVGMGSVVHESLRGMVIVGRMEFNERTDDHMHLKSDTEKSSVLIVESFGLFRDAGNEQDEDKGRQLKR